MHHDSQSHLNRPGARSLPFGFALRRPWHAPSDPVLRSGGVATFVLLTVAALALLTTHAVGADPTNAVLWAFAAAIIATEATELPLSIHGGEHKVILNDVLVLVPLVYFSSADAALVLLVATLAPVLTLPLSWSMRLAHVSSLLEARLVMWGGVWLALELGANETVAGVAALLASAAYDLTIFYPVGQLLLSSTPYGFREHVANVVRVRAPLIAIEMPLAVVAVSAFPQAPWSVPLLAVPLLVIWRIALLAPQVQGLREADRMRTRFVSMASHELQTPLTSIIGFADTLDRQWDRLDDRSRRQFLRIIQEQGERLARLVRDLLVLSSADAGVPRSMPERVDVTTLVRDSIRTASLTDVHVAVPQGLVLLAGPDHALQILVNLLSNAAKYGEAPFEVHARQVGASWVELRVLDAGPGVPEELRDTMFEQFSRGGDVASVVEGSGLGLSIVQALAHVQRGDVRYEARTGGGACFVVRLPAATH